MANKPDPNEPQCDSYDVNDGKWGSGWVRCIKRAGHAKDEHWDGYTQKWTTKQQSPMIGAGARVKN